MLNYFTNCLSKKRKFCKNRTEWSPMNEIPHENQISSQHLPQKIAFKVESGTRKGYEISKFSKIKQLEWIFKIEEKTRFKFTYSDKKTC